MSDDFIVGPAGGCPLCYHTPCTCRETATERQSREARERHARKREKAHGTLVELLVCEACQRDGVVADDVTRSYVCLKCGRQQTPYRVPDA
jgi:hypothetical protein